MSPPTPFASQPGRAPADPEARQARNRWSAYGWVFLRQRSGSSAESSGLPGLGGSQAGAILRRHFGSASQDHDYAYVRATAALAQRDDRELAAGIAVRPDRNVSLTVHAEARVRSFDGELKVRPTAMAVLAPPAVDFGRDFELTAYGEAGYVAGRNATAFAAAETRLARRQTLPGNWVARAGLVGAAAAQRGAARVDIGPTITLDVPIDKTVVRAALDYRQRIAGNAAPGSGLVLTLSTGF